MVKTSQLPADSDPTVDDSIVVYDPSGNATKRVTIQDLLDLIANQIVLPDASVTPAMLLAGTGSSWAWQAWSPTTANITVGNGTIFAEYIQIGKLVHFKFKFTLGSTSAMGSGPTITLPVTPAADHIANTEQVLAWGTILDSGTAVYTSALQFATGSNYEFRVHNASSTYLLSQGTISSTVPMTWANGDVLSVHGFYEAA